MAVGTDEPRKRVALVRNTTGGNWAFGISYSADVGDLMIHFAVWHLCLRVA